MSESREQFFNVLFSLAENHKGGVPDVSAKSILEYCIMLYLTMHYTFSSLKQSLVSWLRKQISSLVCHPKNGKR